MPSPQPSSPRYVPAKTGMTTMFEMISSSKTVNYEYEFPIV